LRASERARNDVNSGSNEVKLPELTSDRDVHNAADSLTDAVVRSTNVQPGGTSLYVVHRQRTAFLKPTPARQWLLVLQQAHTAKSDRSSYLFIFSFCYTSFLLSNNLSITIIVCWFILYKHIFCELIGFI